MREGGYKNKSKSKQRTELDEKRLIMIQPKPRECSGGYEWSNHVNIGPGRSLVGPFDGNHPPMLSNSDLCMLRCT